MPEGGDLSERVLVFAPVGRDAELLAQTLKAKGLIVEACAGVDAFCEAFTAGCGAALLTEEALYADRAHRMRNVVSAQLAWSEVPFIVLTSRGQADERVRLTLELMAPLRNATVIERPVRPGTIVTAVEGALRDRRRQYEVRDAIEALRASEARLAGITDSVDQMIWSTLPDGYHEYFNRRWYEYTGVPEGATDGDAWERIVHPDDAERAWRVWRRSLESGEPYRVEYRLRHRSGEYRWNIGRALPVRDEAGAIVRWYGTCTDVHDLKATEEALRESENKLASVLGSIGDGFYALDREWRFVLFNDVCERYFGRSRAEVLGRVYFDVFPQARGSVFEERFETAAKTGEPQHFETNSVIAGRRISMRLYPSEEGLTALFTDITERDAVRAALAETQRQLSLAQRAGRVGSFSWDIPSDRVIWSPEIEVLYGVPEGTFEGSFQDWSRRVVPEDAARVERDLQACLEARAVEFDYEFRAVLPNGERRWLEGQSRFDYDESGRPLRMQGVNVDIDARKRAEEALREANENLERQVEARTADLVTKIGELEGFCYSVSHDMRTPLRAIVSNAAIVLEDEGDAVGEEGRERLERLSAAAMKMARLIDDLLQYARLGASEPRREACDLTELAQRVADEALLDRSGTDATIRVSPGLKGSCDPRLIGLVLHNLIDNALKYQPPGRPAHIEVGQDENGAFFVRDNGIGFDMAYATKIFKPFERLHRDGDYAGTGIGLANVQRIVERHGGRIWAEGALGEGATFRFTLG